MSYQSTILADSPVAYWRLDDLSGTTAADTSGNNRTATYVGGCTIRQPRLIVWDGFAVALDGSTGYLDCGTAMANVVAGGAYTIEGWFTPTNTAAKQAFFAFNRGAGNNGPQVYYSHPSFGGAGKFSVFDSTAFNEFISSGTFGLGSKVFVVWRVATDGSCTLRCNGSAQGSAGANASMLVVAADTFQVGQEFDAGPVTSDFLFGTIDEVAVFAANLSDGQVDVHYAAGSQAGPSGGGMMRTAL